MRGGTERGLSLYCNTVVTIASDKPLLVLLRVCVCISVLHRQWQLVHSNDEQAHGFVSRQNMLTSPPLAVSVTTVRSRARTPPVISPSATAAVIVIAL